MKKKTNGNAKPDDSTAAPPAEPPLRSDQEPPAEPPNGGADPAEPPTVQAAEPPADAPTMTRRTVKGVLDGFREDIRSVTRLLEVHDRTRRDLEIELAVLVKHLNKHGGSIEETDTAPSAIPPPPPNGTDEDEPRGNPLGDFEGETFPVDV